MTQRPIKFRAWSSMQKTYWPLGTVVRVTLGDDLAAELSRSFVLEQFTGLLDKNGREIYEGDIVLDQFKGKRIARFQDGAFYGFNDNSQTMLLLNALTVEVIGNIHQNPDLIESGLPVVEQGEGTLAESDRGDM